MKAIVNENTKQDVKYPCLMKTRNGLLVLMIQPIVGMVLIADSQYNIGYYSRNWEMSEFTPFNDSITLSND